MNAVAGHLAHHAFRSGRAITQETKKSRPPVKGAAMKVDAGLIYPYRQESAGV